MHLKLIFSLAAAFLIASPPSNAGEAASAPAAGDPVVRGVVTKVMGGRVTLRLDGGKSETYSSNPGTVKEGQRIQASTRRVGDAVRLERIEIQR